MNIATNLHGRLRNTALPQSHGLLPLFEAVINSIHSLEEAGVSPESGGIRVAIEREGPGLFDTVEDKRAGGHSLPDIIGFTVTDNGIGFNAVNFEAFLTLDTEHKIEKGGRGIGRLLWLKAFQRVEVTSVFVEGSARRQRSFEFSIAGVTGGDATDVPDETAARQTTVRLVGFDPRFRARARKTADAIANAMIEHCLWYFVRPGGCPIITLEDDGDQLRLDELFEQHMHSQAVRQQVRLKDRPFELLHIKLRTSAAAEHAIAYCANNRLVLEERLEGRVPGLHGSLNDAEGQFVYLCYVSSPVLDERVRPERSAFDMPTDVQGLFEGTEISWSDIREMVVGEAAKHLENYLTGVRERARERVRRFVAEKAPRYRPIIGRLTPETLNIDPDISDKDLELALHRQFAELERELLDEGHELLTPRVNETAADYKSRIADYLAKVEDVKMSDLAGYVAHRRVVIELLAAALKKDDSGKYVREDLIHTLIMPMRTDSSEVLLDNCNLWLVDERLAFHNYLASDQTLSKIPVTGAGSTKEPDIVALNVFDNPILMSETKTPPYASLVIIELKRPMRDDEKDPVEQALDYLNRIRRGKVQTAEGRPIPNAEEIPGFCYIICDLTPGVIDRCLYTHDLTATSDYMGYFGYRKNMKAYIEVISFDKLVQAAKERNRAFFDKLGLPTS